MTDIVPGLNDNTEIPFNLRIGWFTKDADLVYTGLCPETARVVQLHSPIYDPEMRKTDYDLFPDTLADLVRQQDRDVLRSGKIIRDSLLIRVESGSWVKVATTKWRTPEGTVAARTASAGCAYLYHGWPSRLDMVREHLVLLDGSCLSRAEMRLLYLLLLNTPRKVIATNFHVSVKAIEKRMARLRAQLTHPGCRCYSITGCIVHHRLLDFLLAQPDWFGEHPTLTTHVA